MPTILKRLGTLLTIGLFCLAAFPANGVAEGNSDAADICKQGGYADLATSSGYSFDNTGECVSYAAHGYEFGENETIEVTPEPSPDVTPEPDEPPVPGTVTVEVSFWVPEYSFGCDIEATGTAPGHDNVYLQIIEMTLDGPYPAMAGNQEVPVNADGSFSWYGDDWIVFEPTDFSVSVYDAADYWSSDTNLLARSDVATCDPFGSAS